MADRPRTSEGERRFVGQILRWGLAIAVVLMAVGLVLALVEGRVQAHAVGVGAVPRLIGRGRPSGFMMAGILAMLATPIVRVLSLIVVFLRDRDPRFAVVAAIVAVLLAAGVLVGHA